MSDTGLFSGTYQGIRDQADLLDRVLVRLKAGTSLPRDDERQRLATWLLTLSEGHTTDSSARIIRLLLRNQGPAFLQGWAEVGESLRVSAVSAEEIDWLEGLARALDREQASALSRLRGEV